MRCQGRHAANQVCGAADQKHRLGRPCQVPSVLGALPDAASKTLQNGILKPSMAVLLMQHAQVAPTPGPGDMLPSLTVAQQAAMQPTWSCQPADTSLSFTSA